MIEDLITMARQEIEEITSRALMTQTVDFYLQSFPACSQITLPIGPLQSVTHIKLTDSANTETTFSSDYYHVDTARTVPRIVLAYGHSWPTVTLKTLNPIAVRVVLGYASAAAVPYPLKQAMKLLIEHRYLNRGLVVISDRAGARETEIPWTVTQLVTPYRIWP